MDAEVLVKRKVNNHVDITSLFYKEHKHPYKLMVRQDGQVVYSASFRRYMHMLAKYYKLFKQYGKQKD